MPNHLYVLIDFAYSSKSVNKIVSNGKRFMAHKIVERLKEQQKLDCIHNNPVEAGFVTKAEEWKYSSAIDYYEGKGLLEIIKLDTLIV